MGDCCQICENLPVNETSNELVCKQRETVRRWGTRYTDEEVENIVNVLMENVCLEEETILRDRMFLPVGMHLCLDQLIKKSGRPRSGFITKLNNLGILAVVNRRGKMPYYGLSRKFTQKLKGRICR